MSVENDLIRASVNLSKFHEKTIRGTLLSFTRRVIRETPVDTGRLRNNWQSTLNVPASGELQTGKPEQDAESSLSSLKIGNIFWFVNNLPYARRIEEGYSKQAPQGMLRRNVALLVSKLR